MEIVNKEVEVVVKKQVKQFVLDEKEMRAVMLLIAPLSGKEAVQIMSRSVHVNKNDDLKVLGNVLYNIYCESVVVYKKIEEETANS